MKQLLIFFSLALGASPQCITITGDKIVARDLAKAIPEFALAPPDAVLSFAPIPGLTRNLKHLEIAMFAKRFQITMRDDDLQDTCFTSAAAVLTEAQIDAAIRPIIHSPIISMKILDFGRSPLPPGRLEFREAGLVRASLNAPGTTEWHGRLVTDTGRTFPVWVRMRIVVDARIVVSSREVKMNRVLTQEDGAYSTEAAFPLPDDALTSLDEIAEKSALTNIPQGVPILRSMLEKPIEVLQGQIVHVDAICGDARLSFDARAQTSGRRGDLINVSNPNGRSFRAKVIDKARVEVRSSTGG